MAEDQGKEEEKFDFTPEGESLGYISLDQARVLAMRTAREEPGDYGRRFRNFSMVFEVSTQEETEDYYEVTLSYRPEGDFAGDPGQEQFLIEKEGTVAVRQVLSLPRRRSGLRVLPVAISLVVVGVIIAVGAVFMLGGTGDDRPLAAVVAPTEPPVATEAPRPAIAPTTDTIILTPTPTRLIRPALTPRPTLTPILNASSYYKGEDYYNDGKYQLAIDEFTTAIRLNADYTDAYIGRGAAYYELHRYENAISDYTKAIQLDPDYADAYIGRGAAYNELYRFQNAISDYTKAIQIDPDYAYVYQYRGVSYGNLGQYQNSIADFTKAIQLDPDYAEAYYNRGNAYGYLGQDAEADADKAKVCSLGSIWC